MEFKVLNQRTAVNPNLVQKYDETEWYYTYIVDTNTYIWANERDIFEGHSIIKEKDLNKWIEAVMDYIDGRNDKMPVQNIEYRVKEKRENGQYRYDKLINGNIVESGVATCRDIIADEEQAWKTAVEKFHKQNDVPLPSDEIKANLESAKDQGSNPNYIFGNKLSPLPPSLARALPEATTNICAFPSDLMQGVKMGPTGILDNVQAAFTSAKNQIEREIKTAADEPSIVLKPTMEPVLEQLESKSDELKEIDIKQEAYRKEYATEITEMEILLSQEDLDASVQTPPVEPDTSTGEEDNSWDALVAELMGVGPTAVVTSSVSNYEIPNYILERADDSISVFLWKGEMEPGLKKRFNDNLSYFREVFSRHGVPEQMTVLSIIESAVKNISTENSATAKGMWQFIRSTGSAYGLVKLTATGAIVPGTDKRDQRNPATEAAAKLLKKMRGYNRIDNWLLVAASYNWGPGNIQELSRKSGKGATIWDMLPYMPTQTKNYIYRLIGLCRYLGWSTDPLFE
jgi:hypothetical protein